HGIEVSVAETLDAVAAVAAAGVERETLREALATTLVKDERDRALFDRLFDAAFPLGGDGERSRARRRGRGGGAMPGAGRGGRAGGTPEEEREGGRAARAAVPRADAGDAGGGREDRGRTARRRGLLEQPLELFTARDVAEARDLVRELGARLRGRLARRERALRRGRLDLRRTLRAAVGSGGVPLRLRRPGRRPGRPRL